MTDAATIRHLLTDPLDVTTRLGLRGRRRGVLVRVACPWHRPDRDPSCVLSVGPDGTLRAHCFSCGGGGDLLSLIAAVHDLDVRLDFRRVLELAAEHAGVRLDDRARPPPRDPIVDLAHRIDLVSSDYARGRRDRVVDATIECAAPRDVAEALHLLDEADARAAEIERFREQELERKALAFEREGAQQ